MSNKSSYTQNVWADFEDGQRKLKEEAMGDKMTRTTFTMTLSTKAQKQERGTVPFNCDQDEDDDGSVAALHKLHLDKSAWEDMGSPETITVSVVPGDALNEEV